MAKTYNFTAKELVELVIKNPVDGMRTMTDKELEMERHLMYIGKESNEKE